MRMVVIATLALAAACGTEQPAANQESSEVIEPTGNASATAPAAGASAELRTAAGEARGQATAAQSGDDIMVRITATGMEPGTYAAHVHMTGRCEAPAFQSAGGHWNPTDREHGRENPQGMHKGDLPNLTIAADGSGSLDFTIEDAAMNGSPTGLLDADGAAVVIHAQPDDYRTNPSGNAGDRIACGVLS